MFGLGFALVVSHSGYKYFVTFIDDYSHFIQVYFLHAKSEVIHAFKQFLAFMENQFSTYIKVLGSYLKGHVPVQLYPTTKLGY